MKFMTMKITKLIALCSPDQYSLGHNRFDNMAETMEQRQTDIKAQDAGQPNHNEESQHDHPEHGMFVYFTVYDKQG